MESKNRRTSVLARRSIGPEVNAVTDRKKIHARRQRAVTRVNGRKPVRRATVPVRDKGETNRRHIVETAHRLFYERGYNETSFTDIADASDIPRGNFYYYFKTKDDILIAVIDHRLGNIRRALTEWETNEKGPRERLMRLFETMRNTSKDTARYGCPIGSLNIELGKGQPDLKDKAKEMFDVYRLWVDGQLKALGVKDHDQLALHVLGRWQGISVISHIYGETRLLHKEVDHLERWLYEQI